MSSDADTLDEALTARQHAVQATLPMTMLGADGAQLTVIDASSASWPDDLGRSLDAAPAGVLLVEPTCAVAAPAVRALAARTDRAGVPVVIERAWAGHPAVADLRRAGGRVLAAAVLVDSVAMVPEDVDQAAVLGAQLAVVRALGAPLDSIAVARRDAGGYSVHGRAARASVVLTSCWTAVSAPTVRAALYGTDGDVHLEVRDDGTAAPADAWIVTADDKSIRPTWYESASRAAWRRLLAAVPERQPVPDLVELAADVEVAAQSMTRW